MPRSNGSRPEDAFALQLKAVGIGGEREYRFARPRRWRFDFAWPLTKVAVEIEGGVWVRGRHIRPSGFIKDAEKYNTAASLGWAVLRFTPQQVSSGEALRYTEVLLLKAATQQAVEMYRGALEKLED